MESKKTVWTVSTRLSRGSKVYEVAVVRTDNISGLSVFGLESKSKIIISAGQSVPEPALLEILKDAAGKYKDILNGVDKPKEKTAKDAFLFALDLGYKEGSEYGTPDADAEFIKWLNSK